jgi:hypothetical protein
MVFPTQTIQSDRTQRESQTHTPEEAVGNLVCHCKKYAAENPASAALWCLGIGFVLGWKLKPW